VDPEIKAHPQATPNPGKRPKPLSTLAVSGAAGPTDPCIGPRESPRNRLDRPGHRVLRLGTPRSWNSTTGSCLHVPPLLYLSPEFRRKQRLPEATGRASPGQHARRARPPSWEDKVTAKKHFTAEEAKRIGDRLGIDWKDFDVEQYRRGMDVELEHGTRDPATNVTSDDPVLTGKIAWAHLKEFPDYYTRLDRMEKEAEEFHKKG
jgi:hypothetical protein